MPQTVDSESNIANKGLRRELCRKNYSPGLRPATRALVRPESSITLLEAVKLSRLIDQGVYYVEEGHA
jgi:hypothetical protein